jgi:transketolase
MRKAFVDTLCDLARQDPRILLLTGDLGYLALEPFRDTFPERFINAGVAEQNMVGVAAGLAEAGFRPYVYSIAPFASLRPFEFIRNGPVAHRLPVRIVGMGMGFDYGHSGPTHYGLEDIGALRTLPALAIVVPADSQQAAAAVRATAGHSGPVYYSLGKDDRLVAPGLNGRFEPGKVQTIREGGDTALVTMGSIASEVAAAAEMLAELGIHSTVILVSNFNPDPDGDLARALQPFRTAFSIEAHTLSGGLAALVSSAIACWGLSCRLTPLGVRTSPDGSSGSQADRWRKHGLDRESIVRTVCGRLRP